METKEDLWNMKNEYEKDQIQIIKITFYIAIV